MQKETKSPFEFVSFEDVPFLSFIYPSDAQKKSGNYKKYRVLLKGHYIDIEVLKGQTREGIDDYGFKWSTKMLDHYGYFTNTIGNDGDEVDVFINGKATENEIYERPIFAVKQVNVKGEHQGEYDEDKLVLGAKNMNQARAIYLRNYVLGWQGLSNIIEVKRLGDYLYSTRCRTL